MATAWYIFILLLIPWVMVIFIGFYFAYKLYHPYRKSMRDINTDGLEIKKLRIFSSAQLELDALLLSATGSCHLVIVAHEVGAFKESKLKIARKLVEAGFNVLLFDLRNHGASGKDRSLWPMSERFTDDIEAVLHYARNNIQGIKTFTLYTFSFSTFPSLYLVRRQLQHPDAIILDSGPNTSVNGLFGKFLDEIGRSFVPKILKHPAFYPLLRYSFQFFGLRMLATRWPPDFSKLESEVLFIINGKDPLFPQEEIQRVANLIPNNHVWLCPDSTHLQAYKTDPENYEKTLLDFLNKQVVAPR